MKQVRPGAIRRRGQAEETGGHDGFLSRTCARDMVERGEGGAIVILSS